MALFIFAFQLFVYLVYGSLLPELLVTGIHNSAVNVAWISPGNQEFLEKPWSSQAIIIRITERENAVKFGHIIFVHLCGK